MSPLPAPGTVTCPLLHEEELEEQDGRSPALLGVVPRGGNGWVINRGNDRRKPPRRDGDSAGNIPVGPGGFP